MKAEIKIFTFKKEFIEDQRAILRRYLNVLRDHGLSVKLVIKKKQQKTGILKVKKTVG